MRLPHILLALPIAAALTLAVAPGFTPTTRPSTAARLFPAAPPLANAAHAADERPTCAPAAPDSDVAVRGGAGGAIHALAVFGDAAYAGLGARLVVMDLSDPSDAKVIGQSTPLSGPVTGVYIAGAYAYVTTRELGLHVVAISDLAAPRVVSELALEGGGLAVTGIGQHVLVAGLGWHMVDVADPAQPRRLVTLDTRRTLASVALAGDAAYFGGEDGTLVTYDIAQPEAPLWQSELQIGGLPRGVAAAGRHVYIVGSDLAGGPRQHGMLVVDAVKADSPKVVASFKMPAAAHAITLRRDRAYIVTADAALYAIDVARPEVPAGLSVLPLAESSAPPPALGAVALAATASRAYVGIGSDLHALDVADPAHPVEMGAATIGWSALRTVLRTEAGDDLAYVAAGLSGLRIVDAGDPDAPRSVGGWMEPAGRPIVDLALSGSHLFLAAESAGLILLDITKFTESGSSAPPVPPLGKLDTPAPARRVAVAGTRAYLAVGDAELWIIDITDPAMPVRRGVIILEPILSAPPPRISDIAVDGTTVYVASAFSGLYVVDAADAASPRLWSHTPRGGDRVAVAGENVLTVREDQDLRVFGMQNPAQPRELGRLLEPDWTLRALAIDGERAFVGAVPDPRFGEVGGLAPGELWTLDIADPVAPRIRDRDPLPVPAQALAVAGEHLFAAAGAEGLIIARPAFAARPRTCRAFLPLLANGDAPPKSLEVELVWQWVNVNRAADRKDLRVADWDGDGAVELIVMDGSTLFSLEPGADGTLATEWIARADGIAWGLDDLSGDGRSELWTVSESGAVSTYAPDRGEPLPFGQIDLGEGVLVRAATVADLLGNGKRSLVTLIAPAPVPPPQPQFERWSLRAWGLPDLAPGWRFAIDRVDPGLSADSLLVAQVDGDQAREIVISFPGGRRPGSGFAHGWVIDPAQSAAQWLLPEGFGAQVAAADIDGDGLEELVGTPVTSTGIVTAAWDADARAEKWRINRSPQPLHVADVTGDGVAEIIAGGTWGAIDIYDAATQGRIREIRSRGLVGGILGLTAGEIDRQPGADILLALSAADGGPGRLLVLPQADGPERDAVPSQTGPFHPLTLRLQGDTGPPNVAIFPEIHAARALSTTHLVLDGPTGRDRPGLRLDIAPAAGLPITPAPLAVEIDDDPWPEAVLGLGDRLHVLDHDGRTIVDRDFGVSISSDGSRTADAEDLGISEPRPVWSGDLDGDGGRDLVIAARRRVAVLRLADLSFVWAIEVPESDTPEALVADIDADGAPEIVLRGRGVDVQAWDGRRREREWLLPDTAWTADALMAGAVDPDGPIRLAVVTDGRVTWYTGADHIAREGPDLWRGAAHPTLARVLDTPYPQLIATGEDAVYVYRHPDDADPALVLPIGAPVAALGVGDVDGDGRLELLLGMTEGVSAYRVE